MPRLVLSAEPLAQPPDRMPVNGVEGRAERLLGPILGLGQPDVLQVPLGLGLEGLGQLVQNVAGLVQPAALFARRAVALAQGLPEAERSVSDGQLGPTSRPRRLRSSSSSRHDWALSR